MESPSSFGDASETIAVLRQEIKARNKDIHAAATFGNQLLEENRKLREKFDALTAENENLKQQTYSLQLDLEARIQTINTQLSEFEIQRKEHESVVKELEVLRKENLAYKKKISNFNAERLDFEKAQDALIENQCLKKKINSLENHVLGLELKLEKSPVMEVAEESDKEFDVELYKQQYENLKIELSRLQCDLASSKATEKQLTSTVMELEEGVRERDKELASYSVEIQKAQSYANELQGEIEVLKLEQIDVGRKGNSVFGEIDDRRKIIEKEYKLLMKRYSNLSTIFKATKKDLVGCKRHLEILLAMTNRTHEEFYIDKLEAQLASSKREMENLVAKLSTLQREEQERRRELSSSNSSEYNYLRVMNEQAEKKIKSLENDLVSVHIKNIADHDDLLRAQRQLYSVEKKLDQANMEIMKLRNQVKELTLTIETEVPDINEENIVVREFDPNKNTHPSKREKTETSETNCTTGSEVGSQSESSCVPLPCRPILKDLNEKPKTDAEVCQTETSPKEKKTVSRGYLAYLDSTPSKENVQKYSKSRDKKDSQCAQQ